MTADLVCPLCGQPAHLLGGPAPDVHAAQPAAHERTPGASPPGPPRGVPRCERMERELARRAEARHAATARALDELIAGGADERDLP